MFGIFYEHGNYEARNALAVADNHRLGLGRKVVYEKYSLIDVSEVVQQCIDLGQKFSLGLILGNNRAYKFIVTCNYFLKLIHIFGITGRSHLRGLYEFVGNTTQCRDNNNHRLLLGLYNILQI